MRHVSLKVRTLVWFTCVLGLLFWSQMPAVHAWVSLISQEKEAPPPQHESGPFVAGPPPLKDAREWIIVEGCSLSGSNISSSVANTDWPTTSHWFCVQIMGFYLSAGWQTRSKSGSELFVFQWKLCVHQAVPLSSRTKVSEWWFDFLWSFMRFIFYSFSCKSSFYCILQGLSVRKTVSDLFTNSHF